MAYSMHLKPCKNICPLCMWSNNLWQGCQARPLNGEKKVFSTNDDEKTAYTQAGEWSWALILHHRQKLTKVG